MLQGRLSEMTEKIVSLQYVNLENFSHSAFSDNFADYEFKRFKVPVSIYRFTWTMESKTKLMHFSFIVVKTRFANSVTFAQTSI